ncbi:MAG: LD-carboxypeptidase [Gemmatimonadaceae bacterium]|nr:LD-carboxypeptidase [Gemmatimonadaceae bacterium]
MTASSLHLPPRLAAGARVALIAPAGPLAGDDDLDRAVEQSRALGWEPLIGDHAAGRHTYFSGDDAQRLHDLNAAIAHDAIDGIWCLRGGYGVMRLLDGIDYDMLRRHPKPLIGYSDVTAIHAAVSARCGLVSYHGPMARAPLSAFGMRSLKAAVIEGGESCGKADGARTLHGGTATGRLAGGNLALVASLCGTPYAVDLDGAILFLEDVNEPVYRIDRMFQQLLLSGGLRKCAGLVLGAFTEMPDQGSDAGRTVEDNFREVAAMLGIPCIAGAPIGHIDDQWTLPIGQVATLDADTCELRTTHPEIAHSHPRKHPMKSGTDLYAEAKSRIREVSPREVKAMQERGEAFTLLDVRDQNEVNLGKVPGAMHISRGTLEGKVESAIPRDANVVIYCAGGNRSALAAVTMQQMGYANVSSMSGGFRDWANEIGDVE